MSAIVPSDRGGRIADTLRLRDDLVAVRKRIDELSRALRKHAELLTYLTERVDDVVHVSTLRAALVPKVGA